MEYRRGGIRTGHTDYSCACVRCDVWSAWFRHGAAVDSVICSACSTSRGESGIGGRHKRGQPCASSATSCHSRYVYTSYSRNCWAAVDRATSGSTASANRSANTYRPGSSRCRSTFSRHRRDRTASPVQLKRSTSGMFCGSNMNRYLAAICMWDRQCFSAPSPSRASIRRTIFR